MIAYLRRLWIALQWRKVRGEMHADDWLQESNQR